MIVEKDGDVHDTPFETNSFRTAAAQAKSEFVVCQILAMVKPESPFDVVSEWTAVPGAEYCSMRYIIGTDPAVVANRVAFIEKTPRIRIKPDTEGNDGNNWLYGPGGCAPEYGAYQPSRDWCDAKLVAIGYKLSEKQ